MATVTSALCHTCGRTIAARGPYWIHVDRRGNPERRNHVARPLKTR